MQDLFGELDHSEHSGAEEPCIEEPEENTASHLGKMGMGTTISVIMIKDITKYVGGF